MYSDLELFNSVQSSIAYKSNPYEDLIQQRKKGRLQSISPLSREPRMQNKTHSQSEFGLSGQEWVRGEWGKEWGGVEKGSGSRVGAVMDKFSKARPNMNKASKWAADLPQSGPTKGIWLTPVCPLFCHFVLFLPLVQTVADQSFFCSGKVPIRNAHLAHPWTYFWPWPIHEMFSHFFLWSK